VHSQDIATHYMYHIRGILDRNVLLTHLMTKVTNGSVPNSSLIWAHAVL
jgi:hypothetical protein